MGYYTDFKLEVNTYDIEEIQTVLEEITHYTFDLQGDSLIMTGKWYHWQNHLIELSNRYPTAKFLLYGEGEEAGDVWRAFAYNGDLVLQEAEIVFPDQPDWY